MPGTDSFYDVLTAAIADFIEFGFDSEVRLEKWLRALKEAAQRQFISDEEMDSRLRQAFTAIYRRQITQGGILKRHAGISKFTFDRVAPRLHAELDRRIRASANLIKLNKQEAMEKTLRRFAGWSTSIPAGGTDASIDKVRTKKEIRKSLASLPFQERRVAIDQGQKFISALNETLAVDGGAIAAVWHSHWHEGIPDTDPSHPGTYHYRPEHKKRDLKVYAIRGNWAMAKGLMKVGPDGYVDQYEKPGQLVFCRCFFSFIYDIRSLPNDMITVLGKKELERVRIMIHGH